MLDVEVFWSTVERARTAAGPGADRAPGGGRPSAVAEALTTGLAGLPLDEIVAFHQSLGQVVLEIDTWDHCAACWIIEDRYLTDDSFSDFRAGLVGLGRRVFDAAARDPDSLAAHPAVEEVARSRGKLRIGDEELLLAASQAYEQRTGDAEAFWQAVAASSQTPPRPGDVADPVEDRWDLRDDAEWRRRLPRLAATFR